MSLSKAALARAQLTKEEAVGRVCRELLDLALFVEHEDADEIRWSLPRELVEEGLVRFLRAQYARFGHRAPKDSEGTLKRIARARRHERIAALAEERAMAEFQAGALGRVWRLNWFAAGCRCERMCSFASLKGKLLWRGTVGSLLV